MEAANSGSLSTGLVGSFGQAHFGACGLGDRRLVSRAVVTADALLRHPGGTLPHKLPRKQLLGFYDFANHPKVNHQNLLTTHRQQTRAAMQSCRGTVLVIHDTTEADYSGLDIDNLGPIGHGGNRGLLLHNVLAVDFADRQVLGLVGQLVHCRRRVPKGETKAVSRRHPQRESRLWVQGVEAVGAVPAGRQWVNLMDRGGEATRAWSGKSEWASPTCCGARPIGGSRSSMQGGGGAGPSCTPGRGSCRPWAGARWRWRPTTSSRRGRRR